MIGVDATQVRRISAGEVARDFERAFGAAPEGVWAAPGRVNLIGEHTDYNLGFALPLAIEQRAFVAMKRRSDARVELASRQAERQTLSLPELARGQIQGWASYVAGAAWALLDAGAQGSGFDLWLDSEVPMGAGLSSSAAVSCASVLACAELWGFSAERTQLAQLAQKAEREIAGVPCGLLDQLSAFHGRAGRALCIDFRSLTVSDLPLDLERARLGLLAIDTRAPHVLADGHYAARRLTCERAAQALGKGSLREADLESLYARWPDQQGEEFLRARHVISENARVLAATELLREGEQQPLALRGLGSLLSLSHTSLRDDYQVTVPQLDVAAEAAEAAGALGARMIGGGFGGSVLALCEERGLGAVTRAVEAAFRARSWPEPHGFQVRPSRGAAREL